MTVSVSLRFPGSTASWKSQRFQIPEDTTLAILMNEAIRSYEKTHGAHLSGAHFVALQNGSLADPDTLLSDGDEIIILAVASGG